MEWVDTHCHLFLPPLKQRLEPALERARDAAVTRIIVPAYDLASWNTIHQLITRQGIYGALGLHPWVADEPISLSQLADQLRAPKMVAIGEIGLDFALPKFNHNQQLNILREQLELAIKLDFPVLLHCRGAFEELLQLLQDYAPNLRGVIHAFSKGAELARRFIDLGFHIAFGGAITRPHATKARQSAASIALERLVLETDAPSIGLEGISPEAVEPCHIATIGESLAQLRNGSLENIAMKTTENARALFNLP